MNTQFIQLLLPCASLYLGVIAVLMTTISDNDQAAYRFHDLMKWLRYLTSTFSMYILLTLASTWTRIEGGEFFFGPDHAVSVNEAGQGAIGCMLVILFYKVAKAFYELEKIGSRLVQ